MKSCTEELAVDALISSMYHSIAQPLTALRGTLDLALRKPLDPDGYRKAIEEAIEQHERLVKTIKEVRQIADASSPQLVSSCDVSELVWEVFDDFEPVAKQHQVTFIRRIGPGIRISTNPTKLRQLLFLHVDHIVHNCGQGELLIESSLEDAAIRLSCSNTNTADDPSPSGPVHLLRLVLLKSLKADLRCDVIDGHSLWILSIPALLGQIGSEL